MKTKSKIEKQLQKKTNSELVETIILAKKKKEWGEVASIIAGPRRMRTNINLGRINDQVKEGEIIVVPGKVLSLGEVTKKIRVAALSFSKVAKEKLLKSKSEAVSILEEIKKNPSAKGIRILE